jgi:DNA-binding response OmpR family regulator
VVSLNVKIKVLLVEDNVDLAATIINFIELEGISCDHATNGLSGLNLIMINHYDVLVLDLNLPQLGGLNVCQQLRARGIAIPIIMLTAKDTLRDKIAGFKAGTDDYLVKPFEIDELLARVIALSTRKSGQVHKLIVDGLVLDLKNKQAKYNGTAIKLTPTTFIILEVLMRASPNPIPRKEINYAIWADEQPESNSLKVHVHYLRKQLKAVNADKEIRAEASLGFSLKYRQEHNEN